MERVNTVHRIDLPRPEIPPPDSKISVDDALTEPIGVHLSLGDTGVLFGTGYDESAAVLIDALDDIEPPDVVVVEHGDPDHYGAVPSLRDAYPDLVVAAPRIDRHRLYRADVDADIWLDDGDAHWGYRAVHLPGHTPGNMSFIAPDAGVLVVGDSFVGSDSIIAADGSWSGPFSPMVPELNDDFDESCRSLHGLVDHEFDRALLTHGDDVATGAGDAFTTLLDDIAEAY